MKCDWNWPDITCFILSLKSLQLPSATVSMIQLRFQISLSTRLTYRPVLWQIGCYIDISAQTRALQYCWVVDQGIFDPPNKNLRSK
jgi:hypothetical protein